MRDTGKFASVCDNVSSTILNKLLRLSTPCFSYPDMKPQYVLNAHPANCICIAFDPKGKYMATGSVDALASLWDVNDFVCVRTLSR